MLCTNANYQAGKVNLTLQERQKAHHTFDLSDLEFRLCIGPRVFFFFFF